MKQLLLLIVTTGMLVISACSSDDSPEAIRKQLDSYHRQSKEIDIKIKELEKQLTGLESGNESTNRVAVVLGEITPELFEHFVEASGNVEAVREALISPEISGQITAIYVREGDRIQKGQVLAQLNTQVTQKSIEEIKTSLSLATDLFQRQQRLWDQKIGSEMQYLESKNNKESLENRLATLNAQLDMARVTSPVSGVVERVAQKNGELAMPGMTMIHVINLDELFVKASVSESLLPYINKGDEIVLKFPSYPDYIRKLKVDRIGSNINPGNRTFEVQVKFPNPDGTIKPNMMASLLINDYRNEQALIIPSRLIKEDLKGKYLYIAMGNSPDFIAQKVYIQEGRSFQGRTEVLSGLSVGDKIILDGFNRVNDGVYLSVDSVKTAK
ncbi:MAG: efflux RND transporter periplasmic adaptor subunit [Lentimicrobium sp.]|nr:efflux RND transporter periplasmic adaptor subunit [Lentimicrobium sp.]